MRFLFVLPILVLVAACASLPPQGPDLDPKGVVLERDFLGRSYARGVFVNSLNGSSRAFNVVLDGQWDGRKLTLREVFAYDDGERDVKTWIFEKVSQDRYTGTREDVIGLAEVTSQDRVVRLGYDVEIGQNRTKVRFEDVIERRRDGVIVNRAVVSKFGLKLGTVDLVFSRSPKIMASGRVPE